MKQFFKIVTFYSVLESVVFLNEVKQVVKLSVVSSQWGFHGDNGGRPGVPKVIVVITDGESHDRAFRDNVIQECEKQRITRFGIAVSEQTTSTSAFRLSFF